MSYKVQLSPHAVRQYQKRDPSLKPQFQSGLDSLQAHPFRVRPKNGISATLPLCHLATKGGILGRTLSGPKIKRLKGRLRDYYRYRVGDYRIVTVVDPARHVVYVDYLQHRKDVYRDMG